MACEIHPTEDASQTRWIYTRENVFSASHTRSNRPILGTSGSCKQTRNENIVLITRRDDTLASPFLTDEKDVSLQKSRGR